MKGPLQLLLYTAIVGLCAGFAWQIYSLYDFRKEAEQTRDTTTKSYKKKLDRKLDDAEERVNSGSQGDVDYGNPKRLWDAFQAANFFGYVPPPPVENNPGEQEAVEVQRPKQPPVENLIRVIFSVRGSVESSLLTLQYKPEANIEPPEGVAAGIASLTANTNRRAGPRDSVGTRGDTSSRNRSTNRNTNRSRRPTNQRPRTGSFPNSGAATGEYFHLMRIGDALWKPHQDVKLVAIDEYGNATFQREGDDYEEDEKQPQLIVRETAGLSQEILRQLAKGGLVKMSQDQAVAVDQVEIQQNTGWQEVEQTQIFERDGRKTVNFARTDPVLQDAQRIFNEELGTKTIRTPGGTKGVQITRVPSNAAQYGVSTGDIVLSINGKSVSSKTEAVKVARSQYDQGRRSFEVEILRNGQRVTQSFVAPDK